MKPRVCISIGMLPGSDFRVCTLTLRSVRVGFPNCEIEVYGNCVNPEQSYHVTKMCRDIDAWYHLPHPIPHATWIERVVRRQYDGQSLVILDGDCCFWESCEDWEFTWPLAGYYIPRIFNDFSQCEAVPRLHTSHLWIQKPASMMEDIRRVYPYAHDYTGNCCPCNPFEPRVQFVEGKPLFWDCCANLFHIVGGESFTPEHLDCYDHVNSASFYKVMHERIPDPQGFENLHRVAATDYTLLRGKLWPIVNRYYAQKHAQVCVTPPATINS